MNSFNKISYSGAVNMADYIGECVKLKEVTISFE